MTSVKTCWLYTSVDYIEVTVVDDIVLTSRLTDNEVIVVGRIGEHIDPEHLMPREALSPVCSVTGFELEHRRK